MKRKTSTPPLEGAHDSWSDYGNLTSDVPRVWWQVPILHQDEEQAIINGIRDETEILEVGAHDTTFANRLHEKGKKTHTFDIDPRAAFDFHEWKLTPKKVGAVIAKQVLEHIPQKEIEEWLHRFAAKADKLVFTIPNFWAPAWVFTNDVTHVNNASLRTWTYWLRRAGYTRITCHRLGRGIKIDAVSWLNALLGQSDPCHSILICATKE